MTTHQTATRPTHEERPAEEAPPTSPQASKDRARAEAAIADADALLDEIDDLLADQGLDEEAEASAFVSGYVQKGGE